MLLLMIRGDCGNCIGGMIGGIKLGIDVGNIVVEWIFYWLIDILFILGKKFVIIIMCVVFLWILVVDMYLVENISLFFKVLIML